MVSTRVSALGRVKSALASRRNNANDTRVGSVPLRKFLVAAAIAAVAVLLLLLLNLAYLYGTLYHQTERGAAFHVLLVDYDGGVVGRSLSSAYEHLKSPSFPTLFAQPSSQYPSSETIIQAVRNRQYWAAIFVSQGASQKLSAALQGGSAAATYEPTDALTYIWNEARYPSTADSVIETSFALLVQATRVAYNSINGTQPWQPLRRTTWPLFVPTWTRSMLVPSTSTRCPKRPRYSTTPYQWQCLSCNNFSLSLL